MKINLFILLVSAVGLTGCTSTRSISTEESDATLSAFNAGVRGREVQVLLRDGTELLARDVQASADTLFFIDENGSPRSAALSAVESLAFKKRGPGLMQGILVGLAGSALGGLSLALTNETDSESFTGYVVLGTLATSIILVPIGGLLGYILGQTYSYRFDENGSTGR